MAKKNGFPNSAWERVFDQYSKYRHSTLFFFHILPRLLFLSYNFYKGRRQVDLIKLKKKNVQKRFEKRRELCIVSHHYSFTKCMVTNFLDLVHCLRSTRSVSLIMADFTPGDIRAVS